MVIRKAHSLKWWITIASILMFVAVALPIGINIWYTNQAVQHSCNALNLILQNPVPPHETSAQKAFYTAIKSWANADGC